MSDYTEDVGKVILRVMPSRTEPSDSDPYFYQVEIETDPRYSDDDAESSDDWLILSVEGAPKETSIRMTALDAERVGRALIRAAEIRRVAVAKGEAQKSAHPSQP